MEINSSQLISLFEKYGFEYKKRSSGHGFYAFTFKAGFFHNAEVVYTDEASSEDVERCLRELENIGYSTKKSLFKNINDVSEQLFNGFFNVDEWRGRISKEYEQYCDKMISLLPSGAGNYSYVQVPYEKDGLKQTCGIIDDVMSELNGIASKLIIIEAPAGFGKTCTSYEILKSLISLPDAPIPFFTEFSRDRQAKVFSHVFVREVDRSFRTVKSELVIDETKNGKIVLVLDGFDELLNETQSTKLSEADFEKAQPMLETIGELLTKSAKVILTSRRSAIFDGEIFQEWKSKYKDNFNVIRYRLNSPEVKDWLTSDRVDKLETLGIDIRKLSNPVLLAYLRSVSRSDFESLCIESSKIVEHYFYTMLERERERQDLLMTPENQSYVLSTVALDMCENDYTSDNREKIISLIKDKCIGVLEETRHLYPGKDRPTMEALASKLATHAFFDRSNQGENKIEFVNEFVFGNYIASGIMGNESNDWLAHDERFVEPAVQSYLPRNTDERSLLWERLTGMREFLTATEHMKYEVLLKQEVDQDIYDETTITGLDFDSVPFFPNCKINNSVFNECAFSNISFNFGNFDDITFISCQFYDCEYDTDNGSYSISFLNCSDNNGMIGDIESCEVSEENKDLESQLEKEVLAKFMPLGSTSITRLHIYTSVLYKIDGYSRRQITRAIKSLKEKGILENANKNSFTAINKSSVGEVKKILGR
ncbi:NACHT domain-containing protein [Edwardsiella tarda]|uniref:NACHT domain-containing protein n=1 Tax=Edwardsiella tarda TaxID=636 RepID=UPI003D3021B6